MGQAGQSGSVHKLLLDGTLRTTAHLVMSLESPRQQCQTNLEDTRRREESLPGWEMCKCKKKISEFCWVNGADNSS
jgi:hypothetical protein